MPSKWTPGDIVIALTLVLIGGVAVYFNQQWHVDAALQRAGHEATRANVFQEDAKKCGEELKAAKESGDAMSYRLATAERAEREMKQQLEQSQAGCAKLAATADELLKLAQKRKAQPVKVAPPAPQQEEPSPAPPAPKESQPETSPGVIAAETDAERMTKVHNEYRAKVGTPPLAWSKSLEKDAMKWAEHLASNECKLKHSDTGGEYGENLHKGSLPITPEQVADSWASESKDYDYVTNSCSGVCGHWTQMVWKDTYELGCGLAICPDETLITVCRYRKPGNYIGQKPY